MLESTWPHTSLGIARCRVSSVLIAIALLLMIGVFHVWLRIEITQREYAVSSLEKQIRKQKYEQKTLAVKVAQLSNPSHIEKVATTRLGLRAPSSDQVITVR